ncbi:hypothetical protein N480_22430 [Pseudoalteromonas luteoviolacea S2607]|nr:hypothetical protein N480_22430 [Pseudoalteromonas luteoviolacea S2607]
MHLVTNNEIKALIDSGLLYDTEIKPYSEFGKLLISNKLNSVVGQDMIGKFSDSYVTFSMKDGLYVYNLNIPYMNILR